MHPLTPPGDRASLSVALTTTYGNRRMASPGEIEKLERRWLENMQGLTFAPLAEAYRKAGRLEEAFQTLELGLAHHPDYVPAHIVRGRCALAAGDDTVAASAFALVLSFDSLNLIALRGLAEISLRSGRPQEAVLHLRRLLEVDPTDVEATTRLAELQAKASPAPAADVAPPPVSDYAPPSSSSDFLSSDPAPGETIFPPRDLNEGTGAPEISDDRFSLGDADDEADPVDLHIDERWSDPGARNEFALANDSETLSALPEMADSLDRAGDSESPDVSLPSIEIDVVPTLKDLTEEEDGPTESGAQTEWASLAGLTIHESEGDSEGPVEAETPDSEVPGDDLGEPTVRLLDSADTLPANPWTPAELPTSAPEETVSSAEDGDVADTEMALPDAEDSGAREFRDEGEELETWPDGPPAVSQATSPSDPWMTAGEADLEARSGPRESEPASLDGGASSGWMSDGAGSDETLESIGGETPRETTGMPSAGEVSLTVPEGPQDTEGNACPDESDERAFDEPASADVSPEASAEPWQRSTDTAPAPDIASPAEGEGDEEGEEDALVVTESMAEIFLRQGHDELALAVYTELARRDPGNVRLQEAISRLAPTSDVDEATPTVEAVPARFAASSTGGESLGEFLATVLAVREPTSPLAVTPPAMDRPREGEPTRPADKHFGLDSVFGDDPADASTPPASTDGGEGTTPSFDEFFSDRSPVVAPPSSTPSDSDSEDLQHFNEWLKGLKR